MRFWPLVLPPRRSPRPGLYKRAAARFRRCRHSTGFRRTRNGSDTRNTTCTRVRGGAGEENDGLGLAVGSGHVDDGGLFRGPWRRSGRGSVMAILRSRGGPRTAATRAIAGRIAAWAPSGVTRPRRIRRATGTRNARRTRSAVAGGVAPVRVPYDIDRVNTSEHRNCNNVQIAIALK